MISCQNVSIRVGGNLLFSNLSFTLFPGSIAYIVGPNGCGKSSLLRLISGIITSESGNIFFSDDISREYILYIGHHLGLKSNITVREQLHLWCDLYDSHHTFAGAVFYWKLNDIIDTKICDLSAGNMKKVALSRVTCAISSLWLLDEVDANLDFNNKALLHNAIYAKVHSGGIVILTSHFSERMKNSAIINLEDFPPLCDQKGNE
jgi:heme exporter protein A